MYRKEKTSNEHSRETVPLENNSRDLCLRRLERYSFFLNLVCVLVLDDKGTFNLIIVEQNSQSK